MPDFKFYPIIHGMELTKKESYAIQINYYLKNGKISEACELSREMVKKFPKEPLSHFMAAKSYYLSGLYEQARMEGLKAFNLSHSKADMMVSAIVTASSMFMLNQYEKAHKMLLPFEKERNQEVKKLMIILSVVLENENEAAKYYRELDDINRAAAEKFIRRLAKGRVLKKY